MKSIISFILLFTTIVLAVELPVLQTKTGEFKLGKKPYPQGTREKWIAAGRVFSAAPLISTPKRKSSGYADNSAGLPPVGNQGYEGSCVHWAGTYAVKTYYMKKNNPALDITSTSGQASPRFTYNLSNAGEDDGGWGHEPFEIFMRYGCPDLAQIPYIAGQYYFLPHVNDFVEGLYRRTIDYVWAWNWKPSTNEIEQLKLHLDNGGVASIALYANSSMSLWGSGDPPWVGSSCNYSDLNHMVCVCGYGPGWYKIMNSWGAGWGSNGFIIVDANYFENYFGDCMFPIEGSYSIVSNYVTLQIKHGRRSDIQSLIFDVNGTESWNFAPTPENLPKGTGTHYVDARSNLYLAIDLTFASWNYTNDNIILRAKDSVSGYAGTIDNCILKKKDKTFLSSDTPRNIPDNDGAYASVSINVIPEPGFVFLISFSLFFLYANKKY
ncbi:MAG: hypothetical protein DRI44_05315 [Chlamydiae bacterium]|nr:MAG: hypothetical protein DRI44_05315 [Chlamydiota bacterium]